MQKCGISWYNNLQIVCYDREIKNSNIVDMLNFLTCQLPSKNLKLTGLGQVSSLLGKGNVPLCLFGKEGKRVLQEGVDETDGWKSCEKFKLIK